MGVGGGGERAYYQKTDKTANYQTWDSLTHLGSEEELYLEKGVSTSAHAHTNTHTHTHLFTNSHSFFPTHTNTANAAIGWTPLVRVSAKPQAEHWNTGSLVPAFGAAGSLNLVSKYTAASRNSTLSSWEASHGKCRHNKKKDEEKRGDVIYVLIHICGSIFLMLLTHFREELLGVWNLKVKQKRIPTQLKCQTTQLCNMLHTSPCYYCKNFKIL